MSTSGSKSNWADLAPRFFSAIIMVVVGLGAIWFGGAIFGVLVALATGAIVWEITKMLLAKSGMENDRLALVLGTLSASVVFLAGFMPAFSSLAVLLITALGSAMALGSKRDRMRFVIYVLWVLVAGYGLTALRADNGLLMISWLVAVVIATDTAGYFAGKTFGGPKFWVAVSPKKTWSGTIAGWIAAAIVGLLFGGPGLALVSALLSFASQMGDAAESALKRNTGIKDSSNLIPGHGGFFDRFDALMGAGLILTLLYLAMPSLMVL